MILAACEGMIPKPTVLEAFGVVLFLAALVGLGIAVGVMVLRDKRDTAIEAIEAAAARATTQAEAAIGRARSSEQVANTLLDERKDLVRLFDEIRCDLDLILETAQAAMRKSFGTIDKEGSDTTPHES